MRLFLRFTAVAAAGLAAAPRLLAQGCAMCYATAQAQDARAARHLDYAILTLLIPSVLLFAGVFIAAMRRSYSEMPENGPSVHGQAGGVSVSPSDQIRTVSTE